MKPSDVGRAGWLGRAVRLPVRLLWGLFLIGATDAAHAQEALMLPRLQSTIQFDGLSDEPAWEHIAPLPLTMYQPTFQGSPTERTEVRLVYDATYLYAAIRCYDTQPASIRAHSLSRDRLSGNECQYALGSVVIVLGQKLFQLFRREPALLRRVAHPVHDPFEFSDGFFTRHQRDGHRDLGTAALLRQGLSEGPHDFRPDGDGFRLHRVTSCV